MASRLTTTQRGIRRLQVRPLSRSLLLPTSTDSLRSAHCGRRKVHQVLQIAAGQWRRRRRRAAWRSDTCGLRAAGRGFPCEFGLPLGSGLSFSFGHEHERCTNVFLCFSCYFDAPCFFLWPGFRYHDKANRERFRLF